MHLIKKSFHHIKRIFIFSRTVIFEKSGALAYKDIPDVFCKENHKIEKNIAVNSPRRNQGNSFGSDYMNGSFENQNDYGLENNIDSSYETFRGNVGNQHRNPDGRSVHDSSRSFDHGSKGRKNSIRRRGERHSRERQGGDRRGGEKQGGDRRGGEKQGGDRRGGEKQGGERQGEGRFDKKYSTNKTNESDFSNFSQQHAVNNKPQVSFNFIKSEFSIILYYQK